MTSNRIPRPAAPRLAGAVALALLSLGCSDMDRVASPDAASPSGTADHPADVALAYYDLSVEFTKQTAGFSPPVASRAWGYLGLALYESVAPGMPDHRTFAGILNGLSGLPRLEANQAIHWGAAANASMFSIMKHLYRTAPFGETVLGATYEDFETRFAGEADAATLERSREWGQSIAEAVWAYSITDGGHDGFLRNFPSSYVPPVGEGLWVPTPRPGGLPPQSALLPYWGGNRPFLLAATGNPNSICDPGPPPTYSVETDSEFYAEALEVYETGSGGSNLTPEEFIIADFWADNPGQTSTPPGHWVEILTGILEDEGLDLSVAAEIYARLGVGVSDAFISCWYTKYEHNLLRPITYIRDANGPFADETWETAVATPPFPEYTSGHSVQSGAASRILSDFFGADYAFVDDTHVNRVPPLAPRSFASFDEAADEAAISRLYGGIHYRAAIDLGVTQGRIIGDLVAAVPLRR